MKQFVMGLLVLSIAGCATVKVTPPNTPIFDRDQTYPLPFDKAWTRTVDWFAEHNVTIDKIEKSSGLLTGKYLTKADDNKRLDCGDIKVDGMLGPPHIEKYGFINVTVRSISENESKVTANLFGEYHLEGLDAWDKRLVKASGNCVSTGILEKEIFKYVER